MNPEKRELRIEPIQHKEKKAFCQGAHVLGVVLSFRQKNIERPSKNVERQPFRTAKPPNRLARRFRRPYGKKRVSLRATRSKVSMAIVFRTCDPSC